MSKSQDVSENDIAIVGMAARLPGARTIQQFWKNLRDGVESIKQYSEEDLLKEGEAPDNLRKPNYVRSGGPLDGMELFDGEFYGFSPKESAIMDPQHRQFLEAAWEALENAGHTPEKFPGSIAIFGGCGMGSYFYFNLCTNRDLVDNVGLFLLRHTGNDKDFLVTRVSYLLDLKGPSVNVQTACSTSLVATHMACQSLLSGECDMALAGGVTIEIPHRRGYFYHEGEVLSPDGHCHAFDHRGQGTVFGSGAGVVAMRRLQDAIDDGDHIWAVIKGSAVNNDGSSKVGYLAPSVDGQSAAMAEAHAVAGITADTIDYIEAHGTGTYMGDPIEIAALTQAFRETTDKKGYCRIGSVKTNIGHLDTAAGVASLIKASMALYNREMPPSLNFEKPNPTIDFENSPFRVNDKLNKWVRGDHPRRAAVNSLGVGGTNAHVILEEAPERGPAAPTKRAYHLLPLAARNKKSVDDFGKKLAAFLRENPDESLADVAHSLMVGRKAFDVRRVLAVRDRDEAIKLLEEGDTQRVFTHTAADEKTSLVFMMPGGGSQYARMGADLYVAEPVFKEHVDRGIKVLKEKTGVDFSKYFFTSEADFEAVSKELENPSVQLPAVFVISFALAKLWMSWGIQPAALIGHSLGENTAACLAGVFSFEDALGLVRLRGELVEKAAEGGMISVPLAPEKLKEMLGDDLDLAIVNTPELCVASGTVAAIDRLESFLKLKEIEPRRIKISVAGHSRMLDVILPEFEAYLRKIKLSPPKIPLVSNRTGTWLTKEQSIDPKYWVEHFRNTILFADGMRTLNETPGRVFLEVGPGRILSSLARAQPDTKPTQAALSSMRHPDEKTSDVAYFVTVLGRLWAAGVPLDLSALLYKGEKRRRVVLPTYAFQHQTYFINPGKIAAPVDDLKHLQKMEKLDDYFYKPLWKPRAVERIAEKPMTWLFFMDDAGLGKKLVEKLRKRNHTVVTVTEGDAYYRRSDTEYVISPERGREGYDALVKDLVASGKVPNRIVHLWLVTADESYRPGSSFFHRNMERGFYSLFFLAQSMGDENVPRPLHITAVMNGGQKVGDEGLPYPEKSTVLGPVKVIPREFQGVTCAAVDLVLPKQNGIITREFLTRFQNGAAGKNSLDSLADALEGDIFSTEENRVVAYRDGQRFERAYEKAPQAAGAALENRFREKGVYFITGGLGGLGLLMADYLAKRYRARLVLIGRTPLPDRNDWDMWLRKYGADDRTSRRIARVRELEAAGAEVITAGADVTDMEGMREAVEAARAKWGAVNGVIHTAGVVNDNLIQLKSLADCEDVFAPKIHGTAVLEEMFKDQDLDFMVLFSSTSSVIAPQGQIDYVAANAYLNAFADSRAHQKKPYVVAINWGIWNEVGMAAEALLAPPQKKTEIVDDKPIAHPMFDARVKDSHGETVLMARYSTQSHWILDEHRTLAGSALIPGTGYLEIARAALQEYGEKSAFEIQDLFFFRPLAVSDTEPKEVRFKLKRSEGGYSFEIRSRRVLDKRVGWELHAQAELSMLPLAPAATVPVKAIEERCTISKLADNPAGHRSGQEEHLRFGPRWRVLREVSYGSGEAIAKLTLPEKYVGDLKHFGLHPALLDFATGYAMPLIEGYIPQNLWVPVSYKKVRVRGVLPQTVYSWVRNHGRNSKDQDFALFDITICDESGRVLMEVEEFAIKRLANKDVDFAVASKPSPAEIELEPQTGPGGGRQMSPAELQLLRNLEQGILPNEGTEALARILAGPAEPQVIVTSLELNQLMKQAESIIEETVAEGGTKFARPELDSEFVEARDEVERTLVGFWSELLGVEQIGVKDSFFDLGGHSLIAVRLFAQIKKAYHVEYPISVLFEAPTIERCASMIKEVIGPDTSTPAAGAAPAAPKEPITHRPRYTHLVPMHSGEGGPKTPFFLVAGMFGNVLNLRHLAHLIGTDRPFYGLQARGLYGDHQPHETFEEMARDYLAEMRSVQPHGPYLIGGFSGGGITAYEMAQQLLAVGEKVSLLVMLDSRLPVSPPITKKDKAVIHWQRLQQQGSSYLTKWGQTRLKWEAEKLKKRFMPEEEISAPATFHNEAIEAAFRRALPRYEVKPYPGRVTLFRPKLDKAHVLGPNRILSSELEYVYPDNDWGRFVGEMEVFEVPGSHDSMVLEPNVRVMAARIRNCIQKAEKEAEAEKSGNGHAGNGHAPSEPQLTPVSPSTPAADIRT